MVVRKQHRKTLPAPVLHIGGATIQPTGGARNCSVYFGSHLGLKKHISNACRSCNFQLRQLRVVRRSLPPGIIRTLLHSFVSCRLDYCNSLMAGLPLCDIKRLQSTKNAAARHFAACQNGAVWFQYFETAYISFRSSGELTS